ncbi:hypothetical protein JCM6882_000247 [Rhodosporidiobolus microsporus]
MLTRSVLATLGFAFVASAQLFGDDEGQYADFPSTCMSSCEGFESAASTCSIGDEAESEASSFACICTDTNARALETCASCIITNSADPTTSESAAVAQQLAISFTRGCGLPLSVDGVAPRVSSVLADGGAEYASERSALLETQAISKTVSNGMEVTITLSETAASSTSSPSATTSPSGSSSAPAATQSGDSGAATMVVSLPAPEQIASKTTLQERLARLNLPDGSAPTPSAAAPSTSSVRTGRVTRLSDTISRFQSNAEAAPLLPEGGSFGLAPARPRASGGGSQDRGFEGKPRVASLGGGRAAVPLNVVKPRSASSGNNSPTTRSEGSGSAPGSRAASRQGSVVEVEARPETPIGEPTPVPSPTASTSSIVDKAGSEVGPSSLSLPSGARTPGAMSVSSMNVETGSLSSEGAAHQPADIDVSALSLADEAHSPLSSPQLAGIAIPSSSASSSASIASSDGIAPVILPSTSAGKGPLDGLRIPSRTNSVGSLSSMIVEAPVDDVADLAEMVTTVVATPTTEVPNLQLGGEAPPTPTREEPEPTEEQRASRTREELAKYEKDEADPIAYGAGRNGDVGGEPQEPPPVDGDESPIERPDTPVGGKPAQEVKEESKEEEADNLPKVKCNDCGVDVDLMELADHSCAASKSPPALSSPPTSPQPSNLATLSPPPIMRSIPDVPQEEEEEEEQDKPAAPSSPTSPRNLASSIRAGLSRSGSQQSHKSQHSPVATLDRFVPQTPEDVPEDILDDYADEPLPSRSVPPPRDQSVPEDVEDDLLAAPTSTASSAMARSASTPTTTPAVASHLRAQKKAAGPRSHSVYGIPGQYISSDDEEGEPGSVTIVRSTQGINGKLAALSALDAPPADSSPPSPLSAADLTAHQNALDALLEEPDLLSEIKSGSNQRLTDFLARQEVVLRLGGWVVWGLGRGILDDSDEGGDGKEEADLLGSGVLPDGFEQGKVPIEMLQAAERVRKGMGGVPLRRDVDQFGRFTEGDPDEETEQEKKWAEYPRLCAEILVSNSPNLADILFSHDAATSQPHTCPSPDSFLLPFWESILGSTELQLASRAQQVGFWAKVNSALLDGPRGPEALTHILQIPHLPPRLLSLLPFCSPINDLLLLLLRVSRPPSPLIPSAVTQTIRMLDPFSALGKSGHAAAEELLRGIIEICLAVPRAQGGMAGPGGFGGAAAGAGGDEPIFEWRDTTLARKIADEKSVRTLLDWMLAGVEEEEEDEEEDEEREAATPAPPKQDEVEEQDAPVEESPAGGDETPQPSSPTAAEGEEVPSAATSLPSLDYLFEAAKEEAARKRDLRTSSLIASISVLVELIRKNNSDFVEQQMLAWARRKEAAQAERELLEAEGAEVMPLPGRESLDGREEDDRGPSVVDLSEMLSLVADQIAGFQRLIKKPRSSTVPVPTVSGKRSPLTLERFRICEFYAELLHCSNMSLVNRPDRSSALYTPTGHLARGWHAADDLASALAGPPPADDELDLPRTPCSPDLAPANASLSSTPNEQSLPSFAGLSTPPTSDAVEFASGEVGDEAAAATTPTTATPGKEGGDKASEEEGKSDTKDEQAAPTPRYDDKRLSQISYKTTSSIERDLPATPSIYSVASRQLPPVPLAPGPLLKTKFVEHGVVSTMLDLFFDHPWNNFLHNVVFDLLQQIFHGRLDRPLDRRLAESVFADARLCERILAGQKRNDAAAAERVNMRLGYMGHMTLIAEETVKLFERYPELKAAVESSIPQPDWDTYVSTTLRETRERDLTPLEGASAAISLALNKAPSSSSLSDEDDEFPLNSARAMRAMEAAGGGAAVDAGPFGGHGKPGGLDIGGTGGLSDPFSRYLADALSSDRIAGSSDEDEEDDAWIGGSGNRFEPGDADFDVDSSSRQARQFGFDDRFDKAGASAFRSAGGVNEEDWPPFESGSTSQAADAFGSDDFTPTVSSSSAAANGGFGTSFPSSFDSDFTPPTAAGGDEDDFGDFAGGDTGGFDSGPSITLPPMDSFDDFDFAEESRAASSAFGQDSTAFVPISDEADDGSSRFGRLSLAGESDPGSPAETASPLPPIDVAFANSVAGLGSAAADKATSPTEPLGPSVHEGAHIAQDGFVEAEVEGKTVRVPADDIILAHRRNSFELTRRASLEGPQAPEGGEA